MVSITEIQTYQTCERKHYYQYGRKVPYTKSESLGRGSAFHHLIECKLRGTEPNYELPYTEELIPIVDIVAAEVLPQFITHTTDYYDANNDPVPLIEWRFESVRGKPFVGVIDLGAWENESTPVIVDWKTSKSFRQLDDINPQLALYMLTMGELIGGPVNDGYIVQVKNYMPPRSKEYYRLIPFHYDNETLNRIFDNIWNVRGRIETNRSMPNHTHSWFSCPSCPFKELCVAELKGDEQQAKNIEWLMRGNIIK